MSISSPPSLVEAELAELRPFLQKELEAGTLDLPLLPVVAHQVLLVSGDPNADSSKLSTLIQQDQALAAQILRIANSPAYAPRSPIVSLQQAIAWLGFNMLAGLAFSVSVQSGVFKISGHQQEIQGLWRQALATGLYGKEIARRIRHNVENAFLCGILHLIGKPGALHLLSRAPSPTGSSHSWTALEILLDEFHIPVGTVLGKTWKLPESVQETIQFYQDDQYHHAISPAKGTVITCLAHHLAALSLQTSPMNEDAIRHLPVVRELNFYPEDMTALLELQESIRKNVECFVI